MNNDDPHKRLADLFIRVFKGEASMEDKEAFAGVLMFIIKLCDHIGDNLVIARIFDESMKMAEKNVAVAKKMIRDSLVEFMETGALKGKMDH